MKKLIFALLVLMTAVTAPSFALAKRPKKLTEKSVPIASEVAPSALKEEEWKRNATPNENHKALEPFLGRWTHSVKWWMTPDSSPQEPTGINENSWVLGGRFLKQKAKGDSKEHPFEGLGFTGYDNIQKEYVSVWMDSMSTGIMRATAHYNPGTGTFTESGFMNDPATGDKDKPFRGVRQIIDNDSYTYEVFTPAPDGREFKSLEIHYTRIK